MEGFGMFMIAVCLMTAISCSREEVIDEVSSTRSASRSDSTDLDSGKIRIGDVVIDTAWAGDTIIYY